MRLECWSQYVKDDTCGSRWEDNIKMELTDTGRGQLWDDLVQDRMQWRAFVKTAKKLLHHRVSRYTPKILSGSFGACQ
jgi:hypothetical protein